MYRNAISPLNYINKQELNIDSESLQRLTYDRDDNCST